MIKPELLAPSGDIDSLKAAVFCGANAVYLGLTQFNARAKAQNFNEDNLSDAVRLCRLYGVKLYVTVNTSLKQNELSAFENLVEVCKKADIDAFIVTDFAALDAIFRLAPHIPIHFSTQTGISTMEAAQFAKELGASRVILSRETKLAEIRRIHENVDIELEYFIHGALCVAFSGKCLMSSAVNGNSGNRGRCLQPCRLEYTEKKTGSRGYLLSTSDLCFARRLNELADAGISSFKIEGRLRRPSYVADTVSVYRKILDSNYKVADVDIEKLKRAFNRGNFTSGYGVDGTMGIMSPRHAANMGAQAATVEGTVKLNGKLYTKLKINAPMQNGDGYKLFDQKGAEAGGGRINGIIEIDKTHIAAVIPNAEKEFKLNITDSSNYEIPERKIPVTADFKIDKNLKASLTLTAEVEHKFISASKAALFERAQNRAIDRDSAFKQVSKLGETHFELQGFNCQIQADAFAPVSVLNQLKRDVVKNLENEIVNFRKSNKLSADTSKFYKSILKKPLNENNKLTVELQNKNQLSEYLCKNVNNIVFFPDDFSVECIADFVNAVEKFDKKPLVYLKLPVTADANDIALYKQILSAVPHIFGIYCDNFYAITLARQFNLKIYLGLGLNIYNTVALKYFDGFEEFLISSEINKKELASFDGLSGHIFAYGALPLMNFSHCPVQLNTQCSCASCKYDGFLCYTDRRGYDFKIFRNKAKNCYFTLYNSKITDISAKQAEFAYNFYVNMLQCDSDAAQKTVRAFKENIALNSTDFTYGHFYRGVE